MRFKAFYCLFIHLIRNIGNNDMFYDMHTLTCSDSPFKAIYSFLIDTDL